MGIFYTGIDTDWFKVFLGLVILVAVLVNNYIRAKALGEARAMSRATPAMELRGVTRALRLGDRAPATSTSRSIPARCTACSATTAPASRR